MLATFAVSTPAQAVAIGSATTNFEVEVTGLVAADATHSEWVVPGTAPATDWAGSGLQAIPNLMVFNDENYSASGASVPTDLSPAAIQGSCAGGVDDGFGSGEKIKSHPITAASGTPSADKADICQVFTGYESATNSVDGGQDVIFYLGFTANGNANSTGSVKFWYELNQADDVSNVGDYRTVGDVLVGFQYVGGAAGTVDGYVWSGSDWTEIVLPSGTFATSTPAGVAFAELAINLTSAGLLPRPGSPNACKSFVAGRGMTSASHQTTSAGKDGTEVYLVSNAVSTCGQIRVTKQTLPEDPNSATIGYPANAAFGSFPIQISGGPSGATVIAGSAADNSTVGFVELFGSTYSVAETSVTSGFTATSFTCTKAGVPVGTTASDFMSVSDLTASSTPTDCVLINAKNPTLSITKQTSGPTGSFNFSLFSSTSPAAALAGSPLAISTATTNPQTTDWPSTLAVGSYVLKEADPSPTHLLTSLECTVTKGDGSAAVVTTGDLANGVAFSVTGGDAVACAAFNKGDLSITISKTTLPAGGTGFDFTSSAAPTAFILDDGDAQAYASLVAGSHTFTEAAEPGYYLKAINCSGTDAANVTKNLTTRTVEIVGVIGDDISCEFVNEKLATVSVTKSVAGATGAWSFDFSLDPAGSNTNPRAVTDLAPVTTWVDLIPGSFTLTEATVPGGFEAGTLTCGSASEVATTGLTFTLAAGEDLACTAGNTELGSLTIEKQTSPDGHPETFAFTTTGLTPASFDLADDGIRAFDDLAPGTYVVDETVEPGWTMDEVSCTGATLSVVVPTATGVSVELAAGEDVTCVFQNDKTPHLTVIKTVVTDDGGDALDTDFELSAEPFGVVTTGEINDLVAGTEYVVSEAPVAGYEQTSIECLDDATSVAVGTVADGAATLTLAAGDDVTCTITNDDIAPQLTVVKNVVVDDGGNEGADDFALSVTGIGAVESGVAEIVTANVEYTVSEDLAGLGGYEQVGIECVDDVTAAAVGTDGVLTLVEGQNVTCTISNDDIAPKLTVIKELVTDDGGNEDVADFELLVSPTVSLTSIVSGTSYPVEANVEYTVSETEFGGYTQTSLECVDDDTDVTVGVDGVLTLVEGQNVTCTITNDDIAPKLTVIKKVDNDEGGDAEVGDFALAVTGFGSVTSGVAAAVEANVEYTVSETLLGGYVQVGIECVDDDSGDSVGVVGSLVLDEGQSVTCTIVNDDVAPKLTVIKEVVTDDGGNEGADDFELLVSPAIAELTISSGVQYLGLSNTEYTVSEGAFDGYTQTSIECVDDNSAETVGVDGVLTMAEGQEVTCTITNDDIAPKLKVIKSVVNDNGGSAAIGDFPLSISSSSGVLAAVSGVALSVPANIALTVSESQRDGYAQASLTCIDDLTMATIGAAGTVTLDEGQSVTCTITNDDILPELIDLSIAKRDLADDVLAGTSVVYELTVDNVGNGSTSANATVTDQLPVQLQWTASPLVSAPAGVSCDAPVGQRLQCTIPGSLLDPSDAPVVLQVQAIVPGDVRPTTVRNIAVVDHPQDPCPPTNGDGSCGSTLPPGCDSDAPTLAAPEVRVANVDCEFTTIKPNFDVKIAVSYVGPAMAPGSTGSFELVVSNNGPGSAFDIVITDPLPGPLVVTNAQGEAQECSFVGNLVTCARGALAPGQTWRITVAVQLPLTAGALPVSYSNVVSVSALGDEVPANNVDSAAIPPAGPLPVTGSDVKHVIKLGWILLLGGGALLIAARRRRDELVESVGRI